MDDNARAGLAGNGEADITLGLLSAVEGNSHITQRTLAKNLGIALGLTNAYLRRCMRKGWIKVKLAPANRYAYYLTPHGFAEKSRLTAQYLTISFNFFRRARAECSELLSECATRGWRRVGLAGVSDLAEIALLCAHEARVEIVGVIDPSVESEEFAGLPVVRRLSDLNAVSAVLVTDFRNPQAVFDELAIAMPSERLLTPPLLRIGRRPTALAE